VNKNIIGNLNSFLQEDRILKKVAYLFFALILLMLSGCVENKKDVLTEQSESLFVTEDEENNNYNMNYRLDSEEYDTDFTEKDIYEINMKRDLLCLIMAYPEYVSGFERGTGDEVYVVMKSGAKILYDDKIPKTYEQKLSNADLQDTLELLYPLSDISELMDENYDPGRIRCYKFLKEVYGGSRQEIEKSLKGVNMGGKVCLFNDRNNAAESLKKAVKQISTASGNLSANIFPVNGTYNYRVIAGTNQLSPHAFGIAIDFRSDKRDYWKWASRELGQQRLNQYPRKVVKIMEDNNFIWGGKWAHFDILHFEYRPELIIKARYHVEDFERIDPWYYGFPSEDEAVKGYIETIDKI